MCYICQNKIEVSSDQNTHTMKNCKDSGANVSPRKQKENGIECFICQVIFSHKGNLATHIATVHEGKKAFKWPICDFNCSLKGAILHQFMRRENYSNVPFVIINVHWRETWPGIYIKSVHEDNNNSSVSFVIIDVQ